VPHIPKWARNTNVDALDVLQIIVHARMTSESFKGGVCLAILRSSTHGATSDLLLKIQRYKMGCEGMNV
jgi:hypothetical protein